MKALEQQQEQSDDRLEQKAKLSYPEEIIEEIFSRLPVKSILRFRSLSKPWLSIISGPRFTKLQITRATRTALFIPARDRSNGDRHLFSGSLDGGSVTHLMTIGTSYSAEDTEAEHLNGRHRWYYAGGSVCVNSTVHLMLRAPLEILAFDLRTEKFCVFKIPSDAVPQDTLHPCTRFIKINGLLSIVSHDRVEESNEMHIWILQDYEKRVWVKETIRFPGSWIKMGRPFPLDSGNTDEIMFSPSVLSEHLFEVPIYDMKSRCFKSIQLTLDRQFVWPEAVELEEIKCYVESLIPLQNQQNDTCLRF
ncbi:putative F-box domain-containing protein [Helianthus debilis subsp. tardiflorus]